MKTRGDFAAARDEPDNTLPIVTEDGTCPHWESAGDASLIPMRECWYCKYSDFRIRADEHRSHSVCRCPANQIEKH